MKKLYFTSLLLISICYVAAQNDEGTPVTEIKIIERVSNKIETQDDLSNKSDVTTTKKSTLSTLNSGTSSEVGTTEGQLSVSLAGNANYSIPIAVPPGINGVEPRVSLNYNSNRGLVGTAARGWDIGGISTITRIPTTRYHDNRIGTVELNSSDRFALDGQRLMIKNNTSGTYGADGTIYETENYSNLKIVSYGTHPDGANFGPAYFIVEYPDGSKAYFGRSPSSCSKTEWAINYWENPQGIGISYFYKLTNNSLTIASIKYGSSRGEQPINDIQFVYENRIFPENSYVGGHNIIRDKKIKEIKVSGNTIGYRNYFITSPEGDRIYSITEKSGDNSISYNPTLFKYDQTHEKSSYLAVETKLNLKNINSLNAVTVSGDFDGDGSMDTIIYPTIGPEAKKVYWLYTDIQSKKLNIAVQHNVGAFDEIFPTTWLSWNNKIMPQGWTVLKKNGTEYTFTVYSTGLSSPLHKQYERTVTIPKTVYPKKVVSGDFNGDGLTDVLIIDSQDSKGNIVTGKKVYFVDLKRDNTTNFITSPGQLKTTLSTTARVEVADFNGDGKSDLFVFDNGFLTIYSLNEENKLIVLYRNPKIDPTLSTGFPNKTTTMPILIGDYNGDGKADFIIPKAYRSSEWYKYTSTGTTMIKELKSYLPVLEKNDSNNSYNYITTDFNNDGKADLVRIQSSRDRSINQGFITIASYPNVNGDFTGNPSWAGTGNKPDINMYALPAYLPQTRQSSNSGTTQIKSTLAIGFINQNKIHFFNSAYDYTKSNNLTSITNGNGVKDIISYVPLDSKYTKDNRYRPIYEPSMQLTNYPYLDIEIDRNTYVVSKLERQSATTYKKKTFSYYGAVTNLEGLGFLGFRSTASTNWHDDSTPIISYISGFDMNLRGANTQNYMVLGEELPLLAARTPTAKTTTKENDYTLSRNSFSSRLSPEADIYLKAPINFITKSIITYEKNLTSNNVFSLQNINTKEYNSLENTNSEITSDYDNFNNLIKATTVLKEGETVVQTNITDIAYESLAAPYIIGRPISKKESTAISGDLMTSQETYQYNGEQLLHKIEKKGTNTATVTEDNLYDRFGNITQKTITAPDLVPRITNYQYDTSGRFLTKAIDTERLETFFANNPNNGTLESRTDAYGITTSYTYDKWFKTLTSKNEKLNKTVSYSYKKNAFETLFTTKGDASDGSYMETTFDDLGRKTKSGIKDVTGKMAFVSYLYDINDRNYKVSEPYFGSTPTQWNETKFDKYGRTIETVSFTGRSSTMSYSGLTTTFTDGLKNKIATKNALGGIVSMKENTGGTINYSYFANGNLKQTSYNGTTIKIEQDGWGRKTKLRDATAGTFAYDTNDFGELNTETSQNGGVITTITRDAVGKPIKKTITGPFTDSETTYAYDPTTKLPTVTTFTDKLQPTGFNTIITKLTYDPDYKRVVTIVEDKIGYARFTKTFTYDDLGRIDTETKKAEIGSKSSALTTKYNYKNGAVYQILDNATSQVLWQTNTLNAKGQILENTIGNGIKMTNEYDAAGYLKKIQHDKTAEPTSNIMTLETDFDKKTDNLNSRTNTMFGNWGEVFEYDDLERLTQFTNSIGEQETQNYEPSGRIKENNLGTYKYEEETKPNQNTSIELTPEAENYYKERGLVFYDGMEDNTGWATDAYEAEKITYRNPACIGDYGLLLTTAEPNNINYVTSDKIIQIDNATDTEYTFSARVLSSGPKAEIQLLEYKDNETDAFKTEILTTKTKDSCIYIRKTFTIPAAIKQLRVRLNIVGTKKDTGDVLFDEITLQRTDRNPLSNRNLKLTVDYNAFKSPVQIKETGVDVINFTYNDNNQRSSMFYGNLQNSNTSKPSQKHYAADGSMEIKQNTVTGALEFITYIAGDGYSAPIVAKSDGDNTPDYLYLHRDYQGSIMAITDANGVVLEKRLYDAWGKISKVQDGKGNDLPELIVLDRGYTGHEHLQSVGLINMNARLYDPMLHRFLSVDNYIQDPTNTQNYNQYGYVLNNPLKYTDPSGNQASGNGKDCVDCGPNETSQTLIGNALQYLKDNWDDLGIKDWANRNFNFKKWDRWRKDKISLNNIFGRNKNNEPVNRSSYVNMNSMNTPSIYRNLKAAPVLATNTTLVGIGFGIDKYSSKIDKLANLNNFKIQSYNPNNNYEFMNSSSGITDGKVYMEGTKTSTNSLNSFGKSVRIAGYATSTLGLGMSLIEYSEGRISGPVLVTDIFMTALSYAPPYGTGISAFYFMGVRSTSTYFTHKSIDFYELRKIKIDNTRVRN
ncbi:FG-GAP-like repeat-containing protein [Flavobacterium branchiarum]|uniref:FG-GAP-like repeat-containing protein n=1 Tax=Flavobacterium branchiarum TaxID=1114870 RepID=A0ABV5FPN7_9FLAO|nr:FG-GAP-like repeat-containing protein [Flavobacterium branchiarum]MDN3675585.1 FG-GAP-like repeat-containing protein [Flavobacterium branchiarum]